MINPSFIGYEETSSYWSVQFSTIYRQTSHDSGIRRQDNGVLVINRQTYPFVDESYEVCRLGHHLGNKFVTFLKR